MAVHKNQSMAEMSSRQKMINLMYIVLTAMLALNVSSDVLNGFNQVQQGLDRSNRTLTARNQALLGELEAWYQKYPKVDKAPLYEAQHMCDVTDSLYNYIDSLKMAIVRVCDGPKANPQHIVAQDNLDAAAQVMLPPTGKKGAELRARIDRYRNYIVSLLNDGQKQKSIEEALSTATVKTSNGKKKWEESMFENMPSIAAVTMLSKLQNDIRFSQGVLLNQLLTGLDTGELRVNSIEAFVVPDSRIVMRGQKYTARIVMAAVDTMQRPKVYVNGSMLNNNKGLYEVGTGSVGTFNYSGWIEVTGRDGTVTKREFKSSYTVIEPMASISATMMNVFYAGIDNPVSIAVSGVPQQSIQATMTNGTLVKSGDHWVAHSSAIGKECTISVTAELDGTRTNVGSATFRVRKLPDPTPFIAWRDAQGNIQEYKGGKPFAKGTLLAARGLDAAIDDDLLKIDYRVVSFEMVLFDQMGNAMSERSAGANFSDRQRAAMRNMKHGKRFYISRVRATGPDGVTRDISPMEVIVN
ncbi:MAG: gliding motility protein GldM [Muribaculaceae bacterium]|nr:gliding motility protein GldM [Muribaculaceae bacterium]